jgi:hypothetical protein
MSVNAHGLWEIGVREDEKAREPEKRESTLVGEHYLLDEVRYRCKPCVRAIVRLEFVESEMVTALAFRLIHKHRRLGTARYFTLVGNLESFNTCSQLFNQLQKVLSTSYYKTYPTQTSMLLSLPL